MDDDEDEDGKRTISVLTSGSGFQAWTVCFSQLPKSHLDPKDTSDQEHDKIYLKAQNDPAEEIYFDAASSIARQSIMIKMGT